MATIDEFFPKRPKLTDDDQQETAHPRNLLSTLIRRIRQHHLSLYQTALDRGDETSEEKVFAFLRPEILELYESGKLLEPEELRKLAVKDSFRHRGSSVYLHVIVTPEGIRFYVGQAGDTQKRVIGQHQSESYRGSNPTLHYMALETSTEDFFVNVGVFPGADDYDDPNLRVLDLNTFEMWGGLIFRSLLPKLLRKYLPASIANDEFSDIHLNIRSPLAQGSSFPDGVSWHGDMQRTADPLKKEWYANFLKGRTEELQNIANRHNAKAMQDAMLGERRKAFKDKRSSKLNDRGLGITVPSVILAYDDGTVHFKTEMQPAGEGDHPHCYVRRALRTDVCRRLGIQFTGLGKNGQELSVWAFTDVTTDNTFKKANSLCDAILDVPIEVTEATPRRFLNVNKGRGRSAIVYT